MAQAQIDFFKKQLEKTNNNKITQTEIDYSIQLNETKHARIYYSKAYKDYVLSFNIITRDMWKIFKLNIIQFDSILN